MTEGIAIRPVDSGVRRARAAASLCFWVMGMTGGVWVARIPAVKTQAHLTDAALGLALFAVPIGLLAGAAVAERTIDRVGSARFARVSGAALGAATMTPGLAHNLAAATAALLVVGVTGGLLDVAQNAQGVRVENAYGRPVMTSMHACFSLGSISGALAGGGFAWAGVAAFPSLAAAGVAGLVTVAVAGHWLLAEAEPAPRPAQGPAQWPAGAGEPAVPPRPVNPADPAVPAEPAVPREPAPPGEPAAGAPRLPAAGGPGPDRRHVRRVVLALGILGVCSMVGEGAAADWSAVYLRDDLGTSAGFAALGFAAYAAMMTIGRLAGDRLVYRFGPVNVIRACGVTAAVGLAGALATTAPWVTIAGFAVFGAGLSVVVPQVFAAGGRADPQRPGSGLARVVGLGYAGQSGGPAVIGAIAGSTGLRAALLIPVGLALWIAVAAPAVRPGPASPAAATGT